MALRAAADGVVKHQLYWSKSGELAMNSIHTYHAGGSPVAQADVDADVAAIVAWATASWRSVAVPSASLQQIRSYDMGELPPTRYPRYPVVPVITGTASESVSLPSTVAPVISLRTGSSGGSAKPLHGRIFHVGLSYLLVNGPWNYNPTTLLTAYDALRTTLNGTGLKGQLVVVSWRDAGAYRVTPLVSTVTHLQATSILGTQRSRHPRQPSFNVN